MPSTLTSMATDECWSALRGACVGRLAVSNGRQPDVFPVNYVIDEGTIVIRTAAGTKLASAIMGGLVAFEIDGTDRERHLGWSVVVHGTAREPHTLPAALHDQALDVEPWAQGEKNRFIQITPNTVTGRRLVPLNPANGTVIATDLERRDEAAQRLFGLALRLETLDDLSGSSGETISQVLNGLSRVIEQLRDGRPYEQD